MDFDGEYLPWGEKFLWSDYSRGNFTHGFLTELLFEVLFNCLTFSLPNFYVEMFRGNHPGVWMEKLKSFSNERMLRRFFQGESPASNCTGREILSKDGTVQKEFVRGHFTLDEIFVRGGVDFIESEQDYLKTNRNYSVYEGLSPPQYLILYAKV